MKPEKKKRRDFEQNNTKGKFLEKRWSLARRKNTRGPMIITC